MRVAILAHGTLPHDAKTAVGILRYGDQDVAVVRDNGAAHCAVDVALHDLAATQLQVPLYRYLGLDPGRSLRTSFTIGLDDTERMRETTAEAVADGYPILKVKLGTDPDRDIVAAVRDEAPGATLRVDANQAWTPRESVENTAWLAGHGVEFVEQPVPASDPDGMAFVRERGALPVAAGAHLAPLLDNADLDGSLLLAEDRYEGVPMPEGRIGLIDQRAASLVFECLFPITDCFLNYAELPFPFPVEANGSPHGCTLDRSAWRS